MIDPHPATDTAKPPRSALALAWTNPTPHAHAVRIPPALQGASEAERLAELLVRMETRPIADFDIEARTERRLLGQDHAPVVRVRLDGWLWFLASGDARLMAVCIRADPEAIATGPLPELLVKAFDRCAAEADALATAHNALEVSGVA